MTNAPRWGYEGARVVVTGAASGMGLACVRMLAELGADITALDLIEPDAPVARFIEVDLSRRAAIDAAVAAIDGPVHALFNVAGVPPTRDPVEVFTINFVGPRHLTESLVLKMNQGRAIANVATILVGLDETRHVVAEVLAIDGFEDLVKWAEAHRDVVADGYMFLKQCFCGYTVHRAPQLIPKNIRINIIGPSTTDTPFVDVLHAALPGIGDQSIGAIGGRSTPEEQAAVLIFLNSAMPSYMTGAVIPNDGGFTAGFTTGQWEPPAAT
jgi:NAD(P)-dependent dehydrogenase (short-subunit alcohol dehydrogenase family)